MPHLRAAVEEARDLGHGYVAPEHLLLALVERPGPVGRAFFTTCGLSPGAAREAVAALLGPIRAAAPAHAELKTTEPWDRAIEIPVAYRMSDATVLAPDELLLALLDRDIADGAVIQAVLQRFGVEIEQARTEVTRMKGYR